MQANTPNVKLAAVAFGLFVLVFVVLLFAFDSGNDEKPSVALFESGVLSDSLGDCVNILLEGDGPLAHATGAARITNGSAIPVWPTLLAACTPHPEQ